MVSGPRVPLMLTAAKNLAAVLLLAQTLVHPLWHLPPAALPAGPQLTSLPAGAESLPEGRGICLGCLGQRRFTAAPALAEPGAVQPASEPLPSSPVSFLPLLDRAEPNPRGPPQV